jgi:type IV pilus biogenesis protein CpaD/CtpE
MKLIKPAAITIAVLMLAACAKPMPMAHSPDFAPVQPLPRDTNTPATGAIFAADNTDLWQAKRRSLRGSLTFHVLQNDQTHDDIFVELHLVSLNLLDYQDGLR